MLDPYVDDDRYGEAFLIPDPGWIFFPHDFYQPLANLILGLTHRHFHRRIRNPRLRGDHGYLPHHPSEQGFVVAATEAVAPARLHAELVDLAPTMLALIGATAPPHMAGETIFQPTSAVV